MFNWKSIIKKLLIFTRKICSRDNSTPSSISSIWVTKRPTSMMWRRELMLVSWWKEKKARAGHGSLSSLLSPLVNQSQQSNHCQRGTLCNLRYLGCFCPLFLQGLNAFHFIHLIDEVWMKLHAFIWWFSYLVKASSPECGTRVTIRTHRCPARGLVFLHSFTGKKRQLRRRYS